MMPGMPEKRKASDMGGSLRVVLPKWWCRKHGVTGDSWLDIVEQPDGSLVIRPGQLPESRENKEE